jgi:hypothetical protein
VLSLIVVAAGYVLAIARRRGPLATAGVAASALGVPVLFGFLTFDAAGGGDSGLPFSLDAIVLASVFIWVVSYFLVAGAQGHAFYVGLATTTFWVYMLDKSSPDTFSGAAIFSAFDPFGVGDSFEPDWGTIAGLSLTFGVVYYLIGFLLDRAGRPGPAVPFMVSGFLAVATGIATASVDLHAIGTGLLLIVTGLLLGAFGARGARRFTTWVWSAGVALGVIVIIGKLADDNAAAAGVSLIASGAVVVLVGHLVSRALLEPDDLTPTGSGLAPRG